jgi:hypothetical protein
MLEVRILQVPETGVLNSLSPVKNSMAGYH